MQSSSETPAASQPTAPTSAVRKRDAIGPFLLLGVEAAILTPQVEFKSGWMLHLASPAFFNVLFLALVLLLLLSGSALVGKPMRSSWERCLVWLSANMVVFYALYRFTMAIQLGILPAVVRWWHAAGWLLLVIAVGVTAWLSFIPMRTLLAWIAGSWHKVIASIIIASTFAMLTPGIQATWRRSHRKTLAVTEQMLHAAGHERLVSRMHGPNPMLGAQGRGTPLIITPFCAEQESLAAFLLICVVLMLANWPRVYKLRMALVVAGGLLCLHLLNATRLFLLIEIAGRYANPHIAVDLAHSRLGGIVFLGISVVILLATRRWWYAFDFKTGTGEAVA